jgi:hypothetical protein
MITQIQRYSFIPVNISIFLLFSNLISLLKMHSLVSKRFLSAIQFFSSTKSQNNLSYAVLSIKHGVIFQFHKFIQNTTKFFSNWSLILTITQIFLRNMKTQNKHANKLHATNYHPPKFSPSIVLNASRHATKKN